MAAPKQPNREPTASEEAGRGKKAGSRKKRAKSNAKLVSKVIQSFEKKLNSEQLKPTVSDFIRLLQLEKELEDQQPREIEVSWVEPGEKKDASEE